MVSGISGLNITTTAMLSYMSSTQMTGRDLAKGGRFSVCIYHPRHFVRHLGVAYLAQAPRLGPFRTPDPERAPSAPREQAGLADEPLRRRDTT